MTVLYIIPLWNRLQKRRNIYIRTYNKQILISEKLLSFRNENVHACKGTSQIPGTLIWFFFSTTIITYAYWILRKSTFNPSMTIFSIERNRSKIGIIRINSLFLSFVWCMQSSFEINNMRCTLLPITIYFYSISFGNNTKISRIAVVKSLLHVIRKETRTRKATKWKFCSLKFFHLLKKNEENSIKWKWTRRRRRDDLLFVGNCNLKICT